MRMHFIRGSVNGGVSRSEVVYTYCVSFTYCANVVSTIDGALVQFPRARDIDKQGIQTRPRTKSQIANVEVNRLHFLFSQLSENRSTSRRTQHFTAAPSEGARTDTPIQSRGPPTPRRRDRYVKDKFRGTAADGVGITRNRRIRCCDNFDPYG